MGRDYVNNGPSNVIAPSMHRHEGKTAEYKNTNYIAGHFLQ